VLAEIPVMQEESLEHRSPEGLLTETAINTDSSCVIAVTEEFDKQAKIGGIHVAIDVNIGIILQSLLSVHHYRTLPDYTWFTTGQIVDASVDL